MKKFLVLAVMTALLWGGGSEAAYYDEGNDGDSWETAYILVSSADLYIMRERVEAGSEDAGKYYKLSADIDFHVKQRQHIRGNYWGETFTGHLDGQNHTINLDTDESLFYVVSPDEGTVAVRNLNITGSVNGAIYSNSAIAWRLNSGIIENCSFRGSISSNSSYSSGLVADLHGGTILNCAVVSADISNAYSNGIAGGIIGHLTSGAIESCIVQTGTVITSPQHAGGIAGYSDSMSYTGTIRNCNVEEGTVITSEYAGGILGWGSNNALILSGNTWPSEYTETGNEATNAVPASVDVVLDALKAKGYITGTTINNSAFYGGKPTFTALTADGKYNMTVKLLFDVDRWTVSVEGNGSVSTGSVSASALSSGSSIAETDSRTATIRLDRSEITEGSHTVTLSVRPKSGNVVASTDVTALLGTVTGSKGSAYYERGSNGSSWENAYVIESSADLVLMRDRVNDGMDGSGKYYKLSADIDLTSLTNWYGIGSAQNFTGHFDGQGHTIRLNSGLFDNVSADKNTIAVRNLNLVGNIVSTGLYNAPLVYNLRFGIIENCTFTGSIVTKSKEADTAGLVSWQHGGTIRDCTVNADISSASSSDIYSTGGIVAWMSEGSVENCTVQAQTTITASRDAGGIVGHSGVQTTVKNCTVEEGVSITALRYAGGIAGYMFSGVNLSGNKWPSAYSESGSGSNSSGGGNSSNNETDDNEANNNTSSNTPQITWNKHRYQVYNENLTWNEAKSRCESLGGHLVTITSTLEQTQIESLLRQSRIDYQSYWLGASADVKGMWHWVTDEVFEKQYANYASGQPDGSGNYLCMYWNINGTNVAGSAIDTISNSGKWDDTTINGSDTGIISHGFICEWDEEQEAIEEAPVASDFQTWQVNPDAWKGDTDGRIPSGANPSPVDTSHLSENPANIQAVTLPVSYDARKENILLPVRNQGVFDTCWAFAALGAMEADYMSHGLTSLGTSPDLSELHLAWFAYRDPSTDKYPKYVNRTNILMEGGDPETAEAFLRRVDVSPVNESEMPYTEAGKNSSEAEQKVKAFINGRTSDSFKKANISLVIDETAVIGNISQNYTNDTETINRIKNQIMEHGALYFRYGNDERGYNDDRTSYYSISENGYYHHAALIVGWDDDYPASNFKNDPGVNGAWLVRTSRWSDKETGEPFNVGDDEYGCFWMSYAQAGKGAGLAEIRSFSVREESPAVKQNGGSIPTKNITSAWCARIFKAERDERLIRISFNTTDNNAIYQLFVNKLGKEKPTDPGRAENPLHNEEVAYAGYHTITLSSPVDLYDGDYYAVIIKMTLSPVSEYRYPTAVEASLDHYIEVSADLGESFFAEGDEVPSVWQDGKDIDGESYKACITTYTEERITYDTEPSITTNSLPEATVNESYNFTLSSTGTQRIEWRSGNVPEDFALSREGVLTGKPTKAGKYDINLTALNDVGYVEKTLSLTVNSSAAGETPPEQETKHEDENPVEDTPIEEKPSENEPEDTEHITGITSSSGGCSSGVFVLGLVLAFGLCVRGKRG